MGYNHTAGERLPGRGATSLAVKSVKALSPHFFLWRESEPIGRWAISGISSVPEAGSQSSFQLLLLTQSCRVGIIVPVSFSIGPCSAIWVVILISRRACTIKVVLLSWVPNTGRKNTCTCLHDFLQRPLSVHQSNKDAGQVPSEGRPWGAEVDGYQLCPTSKSVWDRKAQNVDKAARAVMIAKNFQGKQNS